MSRVVFPNNRCRYLRLLQQWLEYLLRIHKPELIVYQSGVDPLKGDKLGKLSLSRECLRTRTEMLLDLIMAHSPLSKLVITLGGGYQELSVQGMQRYRMVSLSLTDLGSAC